MVVVPRYQAYAGAEYSGVRARSAVATSAMRAAVHAVCGVVGFDTVGERVKRFFSTGKIGLARSQWC